MIHAPASEPLSFEVTNDGTAPHTFAVDTGEGVQPTTEIQPAERKLEVSTLQAATYETFCTSSGHREPRNENGMKVFDLTATEVRWETSPGVFVDAMAYNGTQSGPEIRVRQGDHVLIVVHNEMTQPTIMHFHDLTVPNDGRRAVHHVGPDLVRRVLRVRVRGRGPARHVRVYHSHFNSTEPVGKGRTGLLRPAQGG